MEAEPACLRHGLGGPISVGQLRRIDGVFTSHLVKRRAGNLSHEQTGDNPFCAGNEPLRVISGEITVGAGIDAGLRGQATGGQTMHLPATAGRKFCRFCDDLPSGGVAEPIHGAAAADGVPGKEASATAARRTSPGIPP